VDDKIILRGRQQHLLSEFTSKHPNLDDTIVSTATKSFDAYIRKTYLSFLPTSNQKHTMRKPKRYIKLFWMASHWLAMGFPEIEKQKSRCT
jgi:hypothetical protein